VGTDDFSPNGPVGRGVELGRHGVGSRAYPTCLASVGTKA